MYARAISCRGISVLCALAVALLLASCGGGGSAPAGGASSYTIGGTVSGLAGTGLVLQNNSGNNLAISADGAFTFTAPIASGSPYAVTVLTQPTNLSQSCTIGSASGTVSGSNVSNVAVTCATRTFTIGGAVIGLSGADLVLQNNGGDNLAVSANGAFTFSTTIADGGGYSVAVLTQPPARSCTVNSGVGNVAGANVTNVSVICVLASPAAPTVGLGFGVKELRFTWPAVGGADFYRLSENPDGVSGYAQVATNIAALSFNHTIPVHRRLNASYIVDACNGAGCTASAPQVLGANLTQAIGYVKASNTGADNFGLAVALSGDGNTLAVGALGEDSSSTGIDSTPNELASAAGAVYVYTRTVSGWSQQAYVKALNSGTNDNFGFSVALNGNGNTLAVGALGEASSTIGIDSTPNELASFAGAAYVFVRSAGTWSQQAYVKASNTGAGDQFGASVALSSDGNTLAVGAPEEASSSIGIDSSPNELAASAGAAYVFKRTGSAWSQQAYVKASNAGANDRFGRPVALSSDGNTLAIGASGEASSTFGIDSTPNELAAFAGAAYVFTRTGSAWTQQAYVKASNTGAGDGFGASIGLSGDSNTLAVGAPGEASSTTGIDSAPNELAPFAGAVYVFIRSGSTWSQQSYLKASNTGAGDGFGIGESLALSSDGNTLAVGAIGEASSTTGIGSTSNNSASSAGAAYVFVRSAGTWSQKAYVKASNTGANDRFGDRVALSSDGNTLAVGADGEASDTTGIGSTPNELASGAGAVYLY
jgi:hypothetical protein